MKEARTLTDAAAAEDRDLTAEEVARFDALTRLFLPMKSLFGHSHGHSPLAKDCHRLR